MSDVTKKFHLFYEAGYPYEGSITEYLLSDYTLDELKKRYRGSTIYKFYEHASVDILLFVLQMDENGDLVYMYRLYYEPLVVDSFDGAEWVEIANE